MKPLVVFLALLAPAARAQTPEAPPPPLGVLLLAHGGNKDWNDEVESIRSSLSAQFPIETALGMADGEAMQRAVDRLQKARVKRIVAVPLFISSHSSMYEQTAYLLGLRGKPSEPFLKAMDAMAAHMPPGHEGMGHSMTGIRVKVEAKVPVTLTPALDEDPLAASILAERAKALSKAPSREILLLVAHGPVDESEDRLWLASMRKLAVQIVRQVPFKQIDVFTLRDDAPADVRERAAARLRAAVESLSKGFDVIVVPELLARGGIEDKIPQALAGLSYRWDGQALAPHPNLARWIEKRAKEAQP